MKKNGEKQKPLRKQKEFLEIKCRELKRIGLVQRDRARRAELNVMMLEKLIAILLRKTGGEIKVTDQELMSEQEEVISWLNEDEKSVTYMLASRYKPRKAEEKTEQ